MQLNWFQKLICGLGASKRLHSRESRTTTTEPPLFDQNPTAHGYDPFGYKTAWIAVKSGDPSSVMEFLNVTNSRAADWNSGIEESYDRSSRLVAITPVMKGWVLVTGQVLMEWLGSDRRDDLHQAKGTLSSLSERFGEAQFFATFRVTETHLWACWRNGALQRSFYCDGSRGESIESGDRTEFEALQFSGDDPAWTIEDGLALGIDEESVMEVAGAWSVNPQEVDTILSHEESAKVTLCNLA